MHIPKFIAIATLAQLLLAAPARAITYYTDQKQNCSNPLVKGTFCYGGPKYDAIGQHKTCTTPGVMALTFDDGPSQYTSYILDILKLYKMKATFFIKGTEIRKFPSVVQRMADEGHQIASHTQTHPYLDTLDYNGVQTEMLQFERSLVRENFTGVLANSVIPNYMRAPHGAQSTTSMQVMYDLGYTPVHWTFLTKDAQGTPMDEIMQMYYARLGGVTGTGVNVPTLAAIPQQHDTVLATNVTFQDLAEYLSTTFGSKGLRFVTLEECFSGTRPAYKPNTRIQRDPTCAFGIRSKNICCAASCGRCGGTGCSTLPGGSENCCGTNIINANYSCNLSTAPCLIPA